MWRGEEAMNLTEKIKQILKFPPQRKSRELFRAMNINQAVITYNYHGEVRITTYDKEGERISTDGLFDFGDVLAELTNHMIIPVGKWQEIVKLIENQPSPISREDAVEPHEHLKIVGRNLQNLDAYLSKLKAKVAELKEPSK